MAKVLLAYPNQALWSMVSVAQSNMKKRASRCLVCFDKVKVSAHALNPFSYAVVSPFLRRLRHREHQIRRIEASVA
jgi:hypothetical protein